jgi:hypothetical protein|tara:strand:+ start:138 stop:467 length:330 start_codon:yes stop_codon:yes gene_type:complete
MIELENNGVIKMFKLLHTIMRILGFVPMATNQRLLREIFLLEQENDKLIKDMAEVRDENGSLWDMLDEIKKSDIAEHSTNKMNLEGFLDELKEEMTSQMLKDFKPVGEA